MNDASASRLDVKHPEKSLQVPTGTTLLGALTGNDILLPSACGGKGSCGMCKCRVEEGGRDILPTELAHLNRTEKQNHVGSKGSKQKRRGLR